AISPEEAVATTASTAQMQPAVQGNAASSTEQTEPDETTATMIAGQIQTSPEQDMPVEPTQTTPDETVADHTDGTEQIQPSVIKTEGKQVDSGKLAPASSANTAPSQTTVPYMNIDDLLSLKVVSDPQIAPNSGSIAYVVQQTEIDENTTSS